VNVSRELELIRTLMRRIDNGPQRAERAGSEFLGDGIEDFLLTEHLGLLIAAGYLHGRHVEPLGATMADGVVVTGMTACGRRFLEASTNALSWAHIKHFAERKGSAVTTTVLGEIASSLGMRPLAA